MFLPFFFISELLRSLFFMVFESLANGAMQWER